MAEERGQQFASQENESSLDPNPSGQQVALPGDGVVSSDIAIQKSVPTKRPSVASVPIHTMKEDLSGAGKKGSSKSVEASAKKQPASADETVLPLPNKAQPKELKKPTKVKKKSGRGVFVAVLLFIFAGLGAGAWYFWPAITELGEEVVAPASSTYTAAEVLPKSATILRYSIRGAGDRTALRAMWGEGGSSSTPIADLVGGNPSLLLEMQSVSEFYYVLLPDNARPFLLLPRNEDTEQLFASQQSGVQYSSIGNWIVAHPIDAQVYAQEVAVASWAQTGELPAIAQGMQMQLMVNRSVVEERGKNSIFGSTLILPANDSLVLSARYDLSGNAIAFTDASDIIPGAGGGVVEKFSPLIPADATFVWVGHSLQQDISSLSVVDQGVSGLDGEVLNQPQISELIRLFDNPYTFYRRLGEDGVEDLGMIIELPGEESIALGDPALEASMRALILPMTGKSAGTFPELVFTDGEYSAVPLRYVNVDGQTKALDYALTDDYLLIASSLEGIQALIDEVLAAEGGLQESSDWGVVTTQAIEALLGQSTVLTKGVGTQLSELLPGAARVNGEYPLVVSRVVRDGAGFVMQGVLSLPEL